MLMLRSTRYTLVALIVIGLIAAGLIGYTVFSPSEAQETPTNDPDQTLAFAGQMLFCGAWSPDGTRFAAGGMPGAQVWPLKGQTPPLRLDEQAHLVLAIAWSPDGRYLATGSTDDVVRIWDATSGNQIAEFAGHDTDLASVVWSPDGAHLASSSYDQSVRVWPFDPEADTPPEGSPLTGHLDIVRQVVWSPDGSRLASGSYDRTIRIWQLEDGESLMTLKGHTDMVRGLAWSPDGTRLASSGNDNSLRLWDATTGDLLDTLDNSPSTGESVVWSPDGRWIAVAGGNLVRLWDAEKRVIMREITQFGAVRGAAWSPDSQKIAVMGADSTVRIYQMR